MRKYVPSACAAQLADSAAGPIATSMVHRPARALRDRAGPFVSGMQPRPQRGRGVLPLGLALGRGSPTVSPVHGRGGGAGFDRGRGARSRGGRRGGYSGVCMEEEPMSRLGRAQSEQLITSSC